MSYYYKYTFCSPNPIFAIVQEELKSYFDSGAIDDLMFLTYVDKCLRKLGRASYVITEDVLFIEDFQARLPDNFYAVREAWLCTEVDGYPYQSANSFYSQAASATTIQIAPMIINSQPCNNPNCVSGCDECMPHVVQAVYKTNNELARSYVRSFLLKPGNISVRQQCDVDYMTNWESINMHHKGAIPHSSGYDSFDIRDNKFVTNFRTGVVNILFYATEYDKEGSQLIPDNFRVKEYIEAFIKFKMFETLTNQVTDETYNQLQQKLVYYKQASDEAFILANTEIMKQTVWQKQRAIKSSLNRHKMYDLPTRSTSRYGWRRNQ